MADLIAIGYPDQTTAEAAADEARTAGSGSDHRARRDRGDRAGRRTASITCIPVITRSGAGATWGMFWGFLFGLLFFIPVFGLAIGAGLGALMGKVAKTSIDKAFQEQVRDMVQPGTSALFLMVEKVTPDKAVEAMSKYGGTVLKTSLSKAGRSRSPGGPARRRHGLKGPAAGQTCQPAVRPTRSVTIWSDMRQAPLVRLRAGAAGRPSGPSSASRPGRTARHPAAGTACCCAADPYLPALGLRPRRGGRGPTGRALLWCGAAGAAHRRG